MIYRPAKPILVAAHICVENSFMNSQGTVVVGEANSSSIVYTDRLDVRLLFAKFTGEQRQEAISESIDQCGQLKTAEEHSNCRV